MCGIAQDFLDSCGAFRYCRFSCLYCCGCFYMNNYITWRVRRGTRTQAVIIWRLARWQWDTPWPHGTHNDGSRRSETGQSRRCSVCVCVVIASPDFALCLCKMSPSTLILIFVSRPVTPTHPSTALSLHTHTHQHVSVSAVILPFQSECSLATLNNPFYFSNVTYFSHAGQEDFIHQYWDLHFKKTNKKKTLL